LSGAGGGGNLLTVADGAKAIFTDELNLDYSGGAGSNTVVVTGANTLLSVGGTGNLYIDRGAERSGGGGDTLVVNNAGSVFVRNLFVNAGTGNQLIITNGGLIETLQLFIQGTSTSANVITNSGGIYQFGTNLPQITTYVGGITLDNGTISFRGITNADVFTKTTGGISLLALPGTGSSNQIYASGNNVFRLNSSSNRNDIAQDYTFDTGRGATNYTRLELVAGGTLWRSANLTIGSGGSFLASNTVGTVAATVVSTGSVEVYHSTMTWASNVTIVGSYKSDPSTNIYNMDLTVAQSGTLSGGMGDRFEFNKSFLIHSTNNTGFNLASSSVAFTGGGMHTNAITGQDMGTNITAYLAAYVQQTNFAYGELHLGSVADQVCFTCGNSPSIASNGLYVGWLDLLNNVSLVTNLHAASGIDIYYNANDPRNNYLGDTSYSLTDCNFVSGGGMLIPIIPEPSALGLMTLAALALLARRKQSRA
jgi:hypothetical protein